MRVIHVGPRPGSVGGMASVVVSYLAAPPGSGVEVVAYPTFGYRSQVHDLAAVVWAAARLLALRARRAAVVVHVHLSQGGSFVREGAVLRLAHAVGLPTVATVHGSRFDAYFDANRRRVGAVLAAADRVVVLTGDALERVRSLGLADRAAVLKNPVEVPGRPAADPASSWTVVFAGEVGTRKGADTLLDAWPSVSAAVPAARLVLAGPVPKGQEGLAARAAALGTVTWLGPVALAEVLSQLAGAGLAVLPSRAEAMPKFILEAMAAGLPVVATDVGAVAEVLDPAVGRVVAPGDPAALAQALVELLADDGLRGVLGAAAHRRAYGDYRTERHNAALAGLYAAVARKGGGVHADR